jgi:hypothetical protein
MFIRKKRNKSGAISIQVIDKSSGRYRVLKTLGSSSDNLKLAELVTEAEIWIKNHSGLIEIDFSQTDVLLEQFLAVFNK